MTARPDVIVVGGGFAGVTAARELAKAGRQVLLLEARDRLGGRTWVSSFAGQQVEMGGTWVHWHQPHVFAELRRYGLGLKESPRAQQAAWFVDGEPRLGAAERLWSTGAEACNRLCHDSRAVLERPHDPLFGDIAELDERSVQDRIDEIGFEPEARDVVEGMWSALCSAHPHETGLITGLRWHALAGFDADLMFDCSGRYKIATGTRSLVEAIAADGGFPVRLETAVAAVEQDGGGATVRTRDGEQLEAAAVIVAVAVNTLAAIEFAPELSPAKRAMAAEGQSSHGIKTWIRVRGEHSLTANGRGGFGLGFLNSEYTVDGDTLVVGFGPDADRLDPADRDAVAAELAQLLPQLDVVDVHGHDWTNDEFARGTWSMYRPGQLSRYLRDLQQPEGRVLLAGSDVASGWNGFIDGAIESGLTAARGAEQMLRG